MFGHFKKTDNVELKKICHMILPEVIKPAKHITDILDCGNALCVTQCFNVFRKCPV